MPNPHDRLFKRVFGEPEHAINELRCVLPADLESRIAWETLRAEPGSFVDQGLRESHSDVLFSVQLAGHETWLYLLLEHKSQQDRWAVLQVLGYVVEIWRRRAREHPKDPLPAVVAILVHHGPRPWSAPTEIAELLHVDHEHEDTVSSRTVRFRICVDDLSTLDERQLRGRALSSVATLALFCLQRLRDAECPWDELLRVSDLVRDLARSQDGLSFLFTVLSYIMEVRREPSREACQEFLENALGAEVEPVMTSWFENIKHEGRVEGRVEGRIEGAAHMLQQLLAARFGSLSPDTIDRISAAPSEQLETWVRRAANAGSLAEVFA